MAQTIEEQLEIMKAYADGKPVYRQLNHHDIGEQVEATGHQFNFEGAFYSLTPLDWCTGKKAIAAYETFMRNDSDAPSTYYVTLSREDPLTKKKLEYEKKAVDAFDTFSIFIAGAEWVIRNQGKGIDFCQSLKDFRERYTEIQCEKHREMDRVLSGY